MKNEHNRNKLKNVGYHNQISMSNRYCMVLCHWHFLVIQRPLLGVKYIFLVTSIMTFKTIYGNIYFLFYFFYFNQNYF